MNHTLCNKGREFILPKLTPFQGVQVPLTYVISEFQKCSPFKLQRRILCIITPSNKIGILVNEYTLKNKTLNCSLTQILKRSALKLLTFTQNFPKN